MTLRPLSFSQSALGVMVLGRLLVGCFDVEQVDVDDAVSKPAPLPIDDFDDGDRQPALDSLELWRWSGVNGNAQNVMSAAGPGAHSTEGRVITFDLFDIPDGSRDYQAAELKTQSLVPLDLTAYERFVFWAALDAEATPGALPVRITLYCDDLGDGAQLQSPDQSIPAGASFRAYPSPMGVFHHPDWLKADWAKEQRAPLDEMACLARISALSFYLQPDMPDGQRATASWTVDDAYVQ